MQPAGFVAHSEAFSWGVLRIRPRQRGRHFTRSGVLLLCLLAVLAGRKPSSISRGSARRSLLRRFLPFRDGAVSSHDHPANFRDARPTEFSVASTWVAKLIGVSADVVAIDGKTLRGSHKKGGKRRSNASPFAARSACSAKSKWRTSEIIAIPALSTCWRSRALSSHRRDGLPARHRPESPRQEGRLHPRSKATRALREDVELFALSRRLGAKHRSETAGDHGA
jgi:hypothetical protein